MRIHPIVKALVVSVAITLCAVSQARADDIYGRIRGTVTDPSGLVVPVATITVTNMATGVTRSVKVSATGTYEVLNLQAPASYIVTAEAPGFRKFEAHGIPLALDQIYVLNIALELGPTSQQVTVEAAPSQVESTSMQLGTVINSRSIVDLPLNGRNWVQLQQLQPGVVSASDGRGNYATNGSQADQNSYLINGTDNNDFILNTVQVTPSPDAIAEFKMVTSTINPEYGRNSGAILNAVIKSGSNQFHGDGFNFYRDTSLNARNFFAPSPDVFHRNQFGGTVGGPVWKNHTFFFFSYQGTRERRPENSGDCGCASPGTVPVYSADQRNGFFSDVATSSTLSPFPLTGESGATYAAGTPYSTIFPTGHIPTSDFNSVSSGLLKYVPAPTVGANYEFQPVFGLLDDQYLGRIDHTFSSKDAIWGYWLWERESDNSVLPFVGATVPGFGQTDAEHFQQYTAAWNHTFSSSMLNEARVGYTRLNFVAIEPQTPTSPASAGFTGITPQLTSGEGIPVINVLGYFNLGFSEDGPQPRIDQTYQFTDNLTKIAGGHTFKVGFEMRRFQIYNPFSHLNDGVFNFYGCGPYSTGDPGADFLLGIPSGVCTSSSSYSQASGDINNTRTQEYYSYFQDQWKFRHNLTLTYGVGWSIDTPTVDNYHNNHAGIDFIPGMQSTVFPTAPTGYVFQGDPGVNAFGTTHFRDFGPRFGFAYSPNWGWLTGGPDKTSIRAGFGIYFNRFNGETTGQTQGSPPFADSSTGVTDISTAALPLSPGFANPFADIAGNGSEANKFPYAPSATPNFSLLEPMTISVYDPHISVPYSENFNFTIERQVGENTIISLAYVGSLGHRELLTIEQNPGLQPAACAANPLCSGPTAAGPQSVDFPSHFRYPGNIISSIGDVATVGNSNYNALQATLERHFSHGLQFLAAYTWAHALDNGSGFENSGFGGGGFGGFGQTRGINPFNQGLNYGASTYDATNRFVINYVYAFPSIRHFDSLHWLPSRLTDGWQMSGITTLQSGFPVDVIDSAEPSLTCPSPGFYVCWDVPNLVEPAKSTRLNPRTNPGNLIFNPLAFAAPALGTQGNAGRNLLRGPGLNNFDFALMKETRITEGTRIELRFEFFNLFNHTQFDPAGIISDFNAGPVFGADFAAHDPRLIQLAAKLYF